MDRRITTIALVMLPLLLAGCVYVVPKRDGSVGLSLTPPSSDSSMSATATTTGSAGGTATGSQGGAKSTGTSAGPARPGQELVSGPWKAVVESTSVRRSLPDGAKPAGGHRFLIVNVAIRNVGSNAALVVRPGQFRLSNTHGVEVKPYPTTLSAFNAQEGRPIEVGMGGYTSFVYEVPTGAEVYGFMLTPGQGASGTMSWVVP